MRSGQLVSFRRIVDGQYVMDLASGGFSTVRRFIHRRRVYFLTCEKCRQTIADGGLAYRESAPAKDRKFINGVAWCAKCVEGS